MTAAPPLPRVVPYRVPWGAWHGDGTHELLLPAEWNVDVLVPVARPALSTTELDDALEASLETPPLDILARGHRTACIVTEDLARPTKLDRLLPLLTSRLEAAGLNRSAITIVVATGAHGSPSRAELVAKLGEATVESFRVEVHTATSELRRTGIVYGDGELSVNRTFLESGMRILLGSALPHPFAGFGGGAKLVIPGLTDLDATDRSHKFVLMGLRDGARHGITKFREEVEALVARIGAQFTVTVVPNDRREPVAVFCGDLVASHRAACATAWAAYATPILGDYDCLLLNAYPKDVDLIQSQSALTALKWLGRPAVREGGVLVLTTAATHGLGQHGLFGPGGRSYRPPSRLRTLGDRALWLYAPTLDEGQARAVHWSGYPVFRDASSLSRDLHHRLGSGVRAAILAAAPTQILVDAGVAR